MAAALLHSQIGIGIRNTCVSVVQRIGYSTSAVITGECSLLLFASRSSWLLDPGLGSLIFTCIFIIGPMVPQLVPAVYAWPLFFMFCCFGVFAFLRLFALLLTPTPLGPALPFLQTNRADSSGALVYSSTHPRVLIAPLLQGVGTYVLCILPLYRGFVPKMLVMFSGFSIVAISIVYMFIRVTAAVQTLKPRV